MFLKSTRNLIAATLVISALSAQTTHIVNAAGTGQFLDVQPAIDAAQPGDNIVVQAGTYTTFAVDKGLRILFDSGATLNAPSVVSIDQVPAGETVVVRGLAIPIGIAIYHLCVTDCAGHVHLEDLAMQAGVQITRSSQVSIHDSAITGVIALDIVDSTAVVTQSRIRSLGTIPFAAAGVLCRGSDVSLVATSAYGSGAFHGSGPGEPGVLVLSGTVSIAGDNQTEIATVGLPPAPAIEVLGGSLEVDPEVTLTPNGAPAILLAGGQSTTVAVPAVTGDVASQVLSFEVRAPGASSSFVIAGLPALPPVTYPFGEFWVGAFLVLDAGPLNAMGKRAATIGLIPFPIGTIAALQGVIVYPDNSFRMSEPVVLSIDL